MKTVDTDVLVLLLAYAPCFLNNVSNIEVDFGFGSSSSRKFYQISEIASNIPVDKCMGILFCFVFTGCDYTSSSLVVIIRRLHRV